VCVDSISPPVVNLPTEHGSVLRFIYLFSNYINTSKIYRISKTEEKHDPEEHW
jgi:hypothetical protein